MPMKHHSTQSASPDEELKNLTYSSEKDELMGIEKFSDVINLLEQNTYEVDERVIGNVLNYAQSFHFNQD
ncbi:MAG: hypothetical protein ACLFNL_02700 [Bacteroidales bacterium]